MRVSIKVSAINLHNLHEALMSDENHYHGTETMPYGTRSGKLAIARIVKCVAITSNDEYLPEYRVLLEIMENYKLDDTGGKKTPVPLKKLSAILQAAGLFTNEP